MRSLKSLAVTIVLCLAFILAVTCALWASQAVVSHGKSLAKRSVILYADGSQRSLRTSQTTVGAALEEAGITLNPDDLVYPALTARVAHNTAIRVVRVVEKVIVTKEPVPFKTMRRPTRLLRPGTIRIAQNGAPGEKQKTMNVVFRNGRPTSRRLLSEEVTVKPKDRIVLVGDRRLASRGSYTSRRSLLMNASAYDPGPRSCGRYATGYTATGMKAGYGVAAVDPRFIRLGTRLYIEGYGFAIAGDIGRSIKGHRIDLGFDTYYAAKHFGRKRVTVHILN